MKYRIILFFALLTISPVAFSQLFYPATGLFGQYTFPGSSLFSSNTAERFSLVSGAGFSTFGRSGSMFDTWVAPSFTQPLSKKFSLSAGAIIGNTTFTGMPVFNHEGNISSFSGNLTTFTLFTSGTYQMNDRLTISGSAYKTINPAFNNRLNPESLRMEAQGVSVGVGYKIGENMHIGAEIRMQQGNSNFYSPFSNPASPFGTNRFGF